MYVLTLLKRVELEDFKAGHVENADEGGALTLRSVQRAIDAIHEPLEHSLVACLGDRLDSKLDLFFRLRFRHKITTDLDARREECFCHVGDTQAQQVSDLLRDGVVRQGRLIGASLLLEGHRTEQQNSADDAEDRVEVFLRHAHDVHAFDGRLELGCIVDAWNRHASIRQERITSNVVEDEALALVSRGAGQQLIENMECSLILRLTNGSRLLEQISLDVSTRNVPGSIEVDANKFALFTKKKGKRSISSEMNQQTRFHLRISMSCRSSPSWRCRMPRESDSLATIAAPTHPVENKQEQEIFAFVISVAVSSQYSLSNKQVSKNVFIMQNELSTYKERTTV